MILQEIKDNWVRELAIFINDKFLEKGIIINCEIEQGDVYFQLNNENDEFLLSIEIRGELVEFFSLKKNEVILKSENTYNEVLSLIRNWGFYPN